MYQRALRRGGRMFGEGDVAVSYATVPNRGTVTNGGGLAARNLSYRKLHAAGFWGTPAPAYVYARAQLVRLRAEHRSLGLPIPNKVASTRMLTVLKSVLAEDSVYPTLSIDDEGGIVAEWHVGPYSLEIDVSPEGVFTYTIRQDGRRVSVGKSQTPLRKLIRDLSAVVRRVNPNWRSAFHQSAMHVVR